MNIFKKIIIGVLVLIAFALFAFGVSDSKRISNKQELDKITLEENTFATITLDPTNIETKINEKFSVKVYADSLGSAKKTCTIKLDLRFSPEQIKADKWEFADGWISISQPGYDSIDNKTGNIVKTAGYPGCWNGKKLLGTMNFTAQASSVGEIDVSKRTYVLDEESKNVFTDSNTVKIIVLKTDGIAPTKENILPIEEIDPEEII